MPNAFIRDKVAVITGAASGIGRAAAQYAAGAGMKLVMVDTDAPKLELARAELAAKLGADSVMAEILDVSDAVALAALAGTVEQKWGAPSLLMNNAAAFVSGGAGGILDPIENWRRLFDVNVFGPLNGVAAFLPGMLKAGEPGTIVNTGSKQGLTNPPGNPAYNTTKAAVNAYTQNLARDLRERPGAKITAHLLVPGWTTTGESAHRPGAWLPQQVIAYMADALQRGDFFIICPDGETTSDMDSKRILWNALDIVRNRPALSRWHPAYKDAFGRFMKKDLPADLDE